MMQHHTREVPGPPLRAESLHGSTQEIWAHRFGKDSEAGR
jgi:hypothetical protein